MTAPDPLSNTSAMVASEVSVPETVLNGLNLYLFFMLDRDEEQERHNLRSQRRYGDIYSLLHSG